MMYEEDEAPTNASTCKRCKQKIIKGKLRLKVDNGIHFGHRKHYYLCSSCALKVIQTDYERIEKLLDIFEEDQNGN